MSGSYLLDNTNKNLQDQKAAEVYPLFSTVMSFRFSTSSSDSLVTMFST